MTISKLVSRALESEMNFRGLDLNLLVALEALLTEKSVTRAAARVHITQPAMSNALRRIRDHFDDDILLRSGNSCELTPAAQTLLIPVQELLSDAEALFNVHRNFDPLTTRKTFHLMMSDYCAEILLPDIARTLGTYAPHIKFEVEFLNNHALEHLAAGEVDICITPQDLRLLDPEADLEHIRRQEVFRDYFVCLISADHPLARDELSLETFMQCPHICVRFGDGTISMDEQVKRQFGLHTRMVVPTSRSLERVVPSTDLIATVPRRLVHGFDAPSSLAIFRCPLEMPNVVETMFWHPRADRELSHIWLRTIIAEAGAKLGPPPALL